MKFDITDILKLEPGATYIIRMPDTCTKEQIERLVSAMRRFREEHSIDFIILSDNFGAYKVVE